MYKTIDLEGNFRVEIQYDTEPINPREYDNLGTIAYKHDRYKLGEEVIRDPIDWICEKLDIDPEEYTNSYLAKVEELMKERFVILPLYLYDHGDITISTESFGCRWDSGKVGYIYVSKEDVIKEFESTWNTESNKEWREKYHAGKDMFGIAENILRQELKTFDQYLRGEVYGFTLYDNETEEELDSCWGYFGNESIEHIVEECKGYTLSHQERKAEQFLVEMNKLELSEVY